MRAFAHKFRFTIQMLFLIRMQYFPDEVREKIDALYPPPPVVEKVEEKDELETMTADEVIELLPGITT